MVGVWIFAGTTQKEKHRTKDNTPLKALKLFFCCCCLFVLFSSFLFNLLFYNIHLAILSFFSQKKDNLYIIETMME